MIKPLATPGPEKKVQSLSLANLNPALLCREEKLGDRAHQERLFCVRPPEKVIVSDQDEQDLYLVGERASEIRLKRGTVSWSDGTPDLNRHRARYTRSASWFGKTKVD